MVKTRSNKDVERKKVAQRKSTLISPSSKDRESHHQQVHSSKLSKKRKVVE